MLHTKLYLHTYIPNIFAFLHEVMLANNAHWNLSILELHILLVTLWNFGGEVNVGQHYTKLPTISSYFALEYLENSIRSIAANGLLLI